MFAASVVQGGTGLGFGMIAAPTLFLIEPAFVPAPLLVLALIMSVLMLFREGRHVDRKGLTVALAGRLPGTYLAGMAIAVIPSSTYGLVFGVLVLAAVILSIGGWNSEPTNQNLLIAGFASGVMGTLTSIGAPPMALAYQRGEPQQIRATLAAFFAVGCVFSLATLYIFGLFLPQQIVAAFIFLPFLLLGFWSSGFVIRHIDRRISRVVLLGLSGAISIVLIIKSLMAGG